MRCGWGFASGSVVGCERAGSAPVFPVPGPKACVRAGGVCRHEVPRTQNPHMPRAGTMLRAGHRVWWNLLALWQFLGGDATMGP